MNTIDRLRKLLDSFYEGCDSVEVISEIRDIFDSVQDLPDDLAADKEVFESMSNPRLDDTRVPRDVAKLVSATIDGLVGNDSKKKTARILWLKVSGIAAAVILILALGVHFMHRGDLELPDSDILVTSTDTLHADETVVIEEETSVENIPVQEKTLAEIAEPSHNKIAAEIKSQTDIKIVTDPEEAEEYVLMAMNMLSKNIDRAGQAAEEPSNAINMMNQTLNDILK